MPRKIRYGLRLTWLYAKYGLTDEEIAFIESMIKTME